MNSVLRPEIKEATRLDPLLILRRELFRIGRASTVVLPAVEKNFYFLFKGLISFDCFPKDALTQCNEIDGRRTR